MKLNNETEGRAIQFVLSHPNLHKFDFDVPADFDMTEPHRTLSKLFLTVETLGPLVDSGLLLRFPSLRKLVLRPLVFDPAQLVLLVAQCPQLVDLAVVPAFVSPDGCNPITVAAVADLVCRLPRLRALSLHANVAVPSLADLQESGAVTVSTPDSELYTLLTPDGNGYLFDSDDSEADTLDSRVVDAAVQVLRPALQQLGSLSLYIDDDIVTALRPLAPWCEFADMDGEYRDLLNWWQVEQDLQRLEQAEKRAREERDSERGQRTRVRAV